MPARRLSLILLYMTPFVAALGAAVHFSGGAAGCPEWPLCANGMVPLPGIASLLQYLHRLAALAMGLATLSLVGGLAYRSGSRASLLAALAVLVQGCLLSRAGVLVSIARRTGEAPSNEPWLLAGLAALCATGVLGVALRLRRALPAIALGLVACELIETLSSLGALMVFEGARPLYSMAHASVFLTLVVTYAALTRRLGGADAPSWSLVGLTATVMVGGAWVRHTGAAHGCGFLSCNGELWPSDALGRGMMLHRVLGGGLAAVLVWQWRHRTAAVLALATVLLGAWATGGALAMVIAHASLAVLLLVWLAR